MYRTVIVPLDGSPLAEHALRTAAWLASETTATLVLVRAHRAYLFELGAPVSPWDDRLRREEETYLQDAAARVGHEFGIRPQTQLLDGLPYEAICDAAKRAEQPIVVMSSHGRTGFSRLWLGSVADATVRHATTPVLLLKPGNGAASSEGPPGFSRVLVPLDGSPLAEQILPHAMTFARAMGASVHLVRVVQPVTLPLTDPLVPFIPPPEMANETLEAHVQGAELYLAEVVRRLRESLPPLEIGTSVHVADSAARGVVETAVSADCDAVALATHGRGVTRFVLGSVADKVVRAGPAAVLLVRSMYD